MYFSNRYDSLMDPHSRFAYHASITDINISHQHQHVNIVSRQHHLNIVSHVNINFPVCRLVSTSSRVATGTDGQSTSCGASILMRGNFNLKIDIRGFALVATSGTDGQLIQTRDYVSCACG